MTPHTHTTIVPGCYRCDLGRDEAQSNCRHERDPFNVMRCWKCGKKMRAPSMYGRARRDEAGGG